MAKSMRDSVKFKVYKKVRRALSSTYPEAFPRAGFRPPLKVGILKELLPVTGPEISATNVRIFLGIWTNSTAYLQSVSRGGTRVCSKGKPCGKVAATHASEARAILAERTKLKENRAKMVDTGEG